jgi:hypothetical protein
MSRKNRDKKKGEKRAIKNQTEKERKKVIKN